MPGAGPVTAMARFPAAGIVTDGSVSLTPEALARAHDAELALTRHRRHDNPRVRSGRPRNENDTADSKQPLHSPPFLLRVLLLPLLAAVVAKALISICQGFLEVLTDLL